METVITIQLPVLEIGRRTALTGRIYPFHVMKKAVAEYQLRIDEGHALGEFGSPLELDLRLSEVSHRITGVKFKRPKMPRKMKKRLKRQGKWDSIMDLWATAEILQTPKGLFASTCIHRLRLVPRGTGTVNENDQVISDYKLDSIDLVDQNH